MTRNRRLFFLAVLFTGTAGAQVLLQHSIAAAGGSAAGMAGKKVSDGVDNVLTKVNRQLEKAASIGQVPASKAAAGPVASSTSSPSVSAGGTGGRRVARKAALPPAPLILAQLVPPIAPASPPGAPPPPEVKTPTREDVASLSIGTLREQVLVKLGDPAARVYLPEEGRLIEILYFQAQRIPLGAVRLADGVVREVRLN